MKKTYVLDTNVLLSDPECLTAFEDNDLLIPLAVLEELDHHKSRMDAVGQNARSISRTLDAMRSVGNLFDGVKLSCGGTLRVQKIDKDSLSRMPVEFTLEPSLKVDNMIIAFMLSLKYHDDAAILVSKDINVRLKCDALHITSQDYLKMRVTSNTQDFYTGVLVIETSVENINKAYSAGSIESSEVIGERLCPNQIVILKCVEGDVTVASAITRYHGSEGVLKIVRNVPSMFNLQPKNKEQRFAIDLLLDPSVKLVTLTGAAGCGKTILALAAGLEQLNSMGSLPLYDKMIVSRSIQPVGQDIGFLPGSLQEKMDPWIAPVKDNLEFLLGTKMPKLSNNQKRTRQQDDKATFNEPYLSIMQEKGLIEVEAITFIRGRSVPRAFILIDEAQNLSMHEIKTIITRAGEGTKIVITGDITQIDNCHVDIFTNGLTYVIEKFKDQEIAGHVSLIKGERSELATIAAQIL